MKNTDKSSTKIIPTKAIPYDIYIKMVIDAVANDFLLKNNVFALINDVIYHIEDLTKDSPFYHPPKLDTARGHIRTFLRIKKNISEKESYTSTFNDLLFYSLQEYYRLRLNPEHLIDIDFPPYKKYYCKYPIATIFVKQGYERDINEFINKYFDDLIQGTVIGTKCIITYFKNYDRFKDFLRMFFPDRAAEDDESIQQSNAVDDIDDSDDKTEEKEKHNK